jgi:hypothetical protein
MRSKSSKIGRKRRDWTEMCNDHGIKKDEFHLYRNNYLLAPTTINLLQQVDNLRRCPARICAPARNLGITVALQ